MDEVGNWLALSSEDLLWAKASLKEGFFRGACFAAQQSAEKALKAYLLSKEITIPRIHDLVTLNHQCLNVRTEFKDLEEDCRLLSSYYISSRYPDVAEFEEYSEDQSEEAVQSAEKIVNIVKALIT